MNDYRVVRTIGTTEPVSLAEIKLYLGVENNQQDSLLNPMVINARMQAERFIKSDIVSKERQLFLVAYDRPVNLPYAPVASIDSVTINGEAQTLNEGYSVEGLDNPSVSISTLGNAFQRGYPRGTYLPEENVLITYTTAGLDDEMVKQGILALIDEMYSGPQESMKTNWKRWLAPFQTNGYYGSR